MMIQSIHRTESWHVMSSPTQPSENLLDRLFLLKQLHRLFPQKINNCICNVNMFGCWVMHVSCTIEDNIMDKIRAVDFVKELLYITTNTSEEVEVLEVFLSESLYILVFFLPDFLFLLVGVSVFCPAPLVLPVFVCSKGNH